MNGLSFFSSAIIAVTNKDLNSHLYTLDLSNRGPTWGIVAAAYQKEPDKITAFATAATPHQILQCTFHHDNNQFVEKIISGVEGAGAASVEPISTTNAKFKTPCGIATTIYNKYEFLFVADFSNKAVRYEFLF